MIILFGCHTGDSWNNNARIFQQNNKKNNLEKIDARSDEGIFLGYVITSKAYRVFNKRTLVIEESIHVVFDESNDNHKEKNVEEEENLLENELDKLDINESSFQENDVIDETPKEPHNPNLPKNWKYAQSHPKELIIGDSS